MRRLSAYALAQPLRSAPRPAWAGETRHPARSGLPVKLKVRAGSRLMGPVHAARRRPIKAASPTYEPSMCSFQGPYAAPPGWRAPWRPTSLSLDEPVDRGIPGAGFLGNVEIARCPHGHTVTKISPAILACKGDNVALLWLRTVAGAAFMGRALPATVSEIL